MKKLTISTIKKRKSKEPLVMITAYDALFARLFSESADILLVGDSLNMSFGGNQDTLSASMDQMLYHANAVCKGSPDTFVICDMPFGTYSDEKTALANAIRVYRETPADAVKIEGGAIKLISYVILSATVSPYADISDFFPKVSVPRGDTKSKESLKKRLSL